MCLRKTPNQTPQEKNKPNLHGIEQNLITRLQGAISSSNLSRNVTLNFKGYPDTTDVWNRAHINAIITDEADKSWCGEAILITIDKFQTAAGDYLFVVDSICPRIKGNLPDALRDTIEALNSNFSSPEKQVRVLGI
jgi:hypothetical protein